MIETYCGLEVHELVLVIPKMSEAEYQLLKTDIAENGLRDQIIIYEGRILDGRHRAQALDELGKSYDPDYFSEYDPKSRRQKSAGFRALLQSEAPPFEQGPASSIRCRNG
jgi:hypothetical protein